MRPLLLGAIIVSLSVASGPAAAQTASTQLVEEMKGIRLALDRLVALQQSNDRYRRVDLIMKRIELAAKRLAPVEAKLVRVERMIEEYDGSLQALARMNEQQENYLHDEIKEGVDSPRSETRIALEDIERSIDGLEASTEAKLLLKQELENELAAEQREIDILDEMLMELVEDMN
jgi:hypothetical protein